MDHVSCVAFMLGEQPGRRKSIHAASQVVRLGLRCSSFSRLFCPGPSRYKLECPMGSTGRNQTKPTHVLQPFNQSCVCQFLPMRWMDTADAFSHCCIPKPGPIPGDTNRPPCCHHFPRGGSHPLRRSFVRVLFPAHVSSSSCCSRSCIGHAYNRHHGTFEFTVAPAPRTTPDKVTESHTARRSVTWCRRTRRTLPNNRDK